MRMKNSACVKFRNHVTLVITENLPLPFLLPTNQSPQDHSPLYNSFAYKDYKHFLKLTLQWTNIKRTLSTTPRYAGFNSVIDLIAIPPL